MKKEPRNREEVRQFVNRIRGHMGKKPLKRMPITWWTREKKRIGNDKVNVSFTYIKKNFHTCPIERAITGVKYDSCPISVGVSEITAKAGTDFDKALAKELGKPEYQDSYGGRNHYTSPEYCQNFVEDVDYLNLGS
jgi:hypothetical protein